MNKKVFPLVMMFLLTSCTSAPLKPVDTSNSAKIRVFHGTGVYLHIGKKCYGTRDSDVIHAAVGGYSYLVANKKVGMPVTEDTPWSYHEYAIPAGKPVTLEMFWATAGSGLQQSCGPLGATFTPKVGKYYDTAMLVESGGCEIQLRELKETSPGKASAVVKSVVTAPRC